MDNKQTAYALARMGLGIDIAMHGLVRIPYMPQFTKGLHNTFASTILPPAIVYSFATVLPFIELIIGLFILLGLFTRRALISGTIIMFILLFGNSLLQNWNGVGLELGYVLFYAVMVFFLEYNWFSLDSVFKIREM